MPLIPLTIKCHYCKKSYTILVDITSNGDNVWYNWNGTNLTYTTPINVTFAEGSNTLYVYANDSLGNENSTFVTFYVDTISPIVTINSPLNQTYNCTNVTVDLSAIDAGSGVDTIWYNWNGTNITYTVPINVTFNEGSNALYACSSHESFVRASYNPSATASGVSPPWDGLRFDISLCTFLRRSEKSKIRVT